jgi:hypothetical protein
MVPVTSRVFVPVSPVMVKPFGLNFAPAPTVKLETLAFDLRVRVPPVIDTVPKFWGVDLSVRSPVPVNVIVAVPLVYVPADESQLPDSESVVHFAVRVFPELIVRPPAIVNVAAVTVELAVI